MDEMLLTSLSGKDLVHGIILPHQRAATRCWIALGLFGTVGLGFIPGGPMPVAIVMAVYGLMQTHFALIIMLRLSLRRKSPAEAMAWGSVYLIILPLTILAVVLFITILMFEDAGLIVVFVGGVYWLLGKFTIGMEVLERTGRQFHTLCTE